MLSQQRTSSAFLLAMILTIALIFSVPAGAEELEADLLIVGGTESGCAAAVQAARMGVERIVIVNDIAWLGGQFSGEALAAIDENTDHAGVRHDPPIPRHGAFREIIDRIEADNLKKYGVARPGNTRVITTCRPADAERVFREWVAPYVNRGQIEIRDWYEPAQVRVEDGRVGAVRFTGRREQSDLTVTARLTIDASDWGDVIRLSGADYEFGPDLKAKYGEPLAPESRDGYPSSDMNPITYCMVIEETDQYDPIPPPPGYDPHNYREHRYPKDPLWLYPTRRIVDHYHFEQISHPDVLLLCFPAFDYPLDVLPKHAADQLEASRPGSSKANIVDLTPAQRRIIFEDAKQYSLGFLHYLQTEVHGSMSDTTHSFRRFHLSREFGTPDHMPFKPYVRESLRMKAMYMMRQQDTTGVGGDSANFASAMYHDGVAVWQFEYDFHPTRREFLCDNDPAGPWRNSFRPGRTWGPPYSGRSLFSLRSLIPHRLNGLLGAQKNLGYSSIVSAAVRLHDASMGIGQASGATAAFALQHQIDPREIPFHRERLIALQAAICTPLDGGEPGMIWPFRDLDSSHDCYAAVNMLAATGCLPIAADEPLFRPDQPAMDDWKQAVIKQSLSQLSAALPQFSMPSESVTRGAFAEQLWSHLKEATWKPFHRAGPQDADNDGIPDGDDALPFDSRNRSLPLSPVPESANGLPDTLEAGREVIRQFNFAASNSADVDEFESDYGEVFGQDRGYGWRRDLTSHQRQRGRAAVLADTFIFTRTHDVWECRLPKGTYIVDVSIGDSGHEQFGQNVTVEGKPAFRDIRTRSGRFAETSVEVEVKDGRLTVEIGMPGGTTNTCLNWLRIVGAAR